MKFYSDPKLRLEHERNLALGKIADAIYSLERNKRNMILKNEMIEAAEEFIIKHLRHRAISPETVTAIAELMKAASTL